MTSSNLKRRIPELDGVRGLAILLVLLWHYGQNQLRPEAGSMLDNFRHLLNFTWSGVDLFFVLSGFLIAGILIDNRGSACYYRTFYLRRACRILPLYFLNLALFAVFLRSGTTGDPLYGALTGSADVPFWSYPVFLQNVFMGLANSAGFNWLSVTWSLAVEEQFYLFLPLVIAVFPVRFLPAVFVALLVTAVTLRFTHPGLSAYINTPWRMDSLMAGALLAWLVRRPGFLHGVHRYRRLPAILLALTATAVIVAGFYGRLRLGGAMTHLSMTLLYSLLLLAVITDNTGRLSRCFRFTPLIRLGAVSYGVYLIHTTVSKLVHAMLRGAAPAMQTLPDAGVTLVALLVTLVLAWLSYRFFESRFIRYGHRFRYADCSGPAGGRAEAS